MRGWLVILGLVGCGSDDGPAYTGPITANATHYDYALDIDAGTAHSKVTLAATAAGDCLDIPFRAASFANAKFGDEAITATQPDAKTLEFCSSTGVNVGDAFTIEADVTLANATVGLSDIGYSVQKDAQGNQFTYLVSWVNGCDQFGPCDNDPANFATYTFDVTHAANELVRCSGDVTDVSPTETTCDFEHAGGPSYSTFGVAAYTGWTMRDKGTWSGVHVTLYDRDSTMVDAAIDPAFHTGYLDFMQATFGPYPFGSELRLLTAPTYWNGFEHPGNIVLNDTLAKQTRTYTHNVQHVLDHEMTHMWAGDQTTIAATYDFVWKESMAEYLSFVYEDMTDPAAALATSAIWKSDAEGARYWPVPTDMPILYDYYGDTYGPGPMVLFHQLEVLTSRDAVIAALKQVLGKQRALSVDDLLAQLSASTGLDLTDYAAGWIRGAGKPTWPTVATTYASGTLHLDITNGEKRGCKFHVELSDGTPANAINVEVNTFENNAPSIDLAVTPAPAFTVTQITLDPDNECLVFPANAAVAKSSVRGWRSQR
ncbi:MAG: M1 family aminopeptidase [Kofleriaceae bacterium]